MFDPEIRATWAGEAQTVNPNRDIDIPPIVSLLTPGVGLQFGTRECGLFRFGARPEFVLSPHCDDDKSCHAFDGNNHENRLGIKQWVVPEFLGEYRKRDWTVGVAYKQYGLQGCGVRGKNFNFADLNTLTVYGKYRGFLLGASFLSGSHNNDNSFAINSRAALTVGYGYPF